MQPVCFELMHGSYQRAHAFIFMLSVLLMPAPPPPNIAQIGCTSYSLHSDFSMIHHSFHGDYTFPLCIPEHFFPLRIYSDLLMR